MSLIELVVAMAVGSLVLAAAGNSMYQVWTNNIRNRNHMVAVKQVENALHFMVRDVQMAQSIGLPGTDDILELEWVEWNSADTITVTYSWSGDVLTRTEEREPPAPGVGTSSTVAYFISPKPAPTVDAGTGELVVEVTAVVSGSTETRKVRILPRPGA